MEFFAKLSRQHYPPYYSIEGIHFEGDAEDSGGDIKVRILGAEDVENIRIASSTRSSSPPQVEDEEMDEVDEVAVQITTSDAEELLGADEEDDEHEGGDTVECVSNNQWYLPIIVDSDILLDLLFLGPSAKDQTVLRWYDGSYWKARRRKCEDGEGTWEDIRKNRVYWRGHREAQTEAYKSAHLER
jgi:hypothetical protein